MPQKIVAGNWKMNLDRNQAADLAKCIVDHQPPSGVELILCPPAIYLESVLDQTMGTDIGVGAQNAYYQESGAFTGEISPEMVADLGCSHVILGHSERRVIFGETDELVSLKAAAVVNAGLKAIVCVGEQLEQREAGNTFQVVREQFEGSLAGLDDSQFSRVIIAYEPVWAIGTGRVATPEQAEEVHADLRKMAENRYNSTLANELSILYGGSVKPENAADLMAQPNIDGALVGGASLQADSFLAIAQAAE